LKFTKYKKLNRRSIKSRKVRWTGMLKLWEKRSDTYRDFVHKPEENTALGIPKFIWEGNINPQATELNPICN
jgi:hypothetical protein